MLRFNGHYNDVTIFMKSLGITGSALDAAEKATKILEDAGETNAG